MPNELTIPEQRMPAELSVTQVLDQLAKIQTLMKQAMVKDVDYGTIPGTPKPTLLKPGAEKLCLMFRLDPEYELTKEIADGRQHLSIVSRCTLYHIPTGLRWGSGMGSCSTKESRYAYRNAARECPECGEKTVKKGAAKFGGGYYCDKKTGGCGAQFKGEGTAAIDAQETGRMDNPDIADQYNTVLKMSNKRALVAAVLNVTGASQIFTQDVEDFARKARAHGVEGEPRTGGLQPDETRPGAQRQSPDDKATPEQRKALWASVKRAFGEEDALAWIRAELDRLGLKKPEELKVRDIVALNQRASEDLMAKQEQPTLVDDEMLDRFEAAQGQREPGED